MTHERDDELRSVDHGVTRFEAKPDKLPHLLAHAVGIKTKPWQKRVLEMLVHPRGWFKRSWWAYVRTGWYTHRFKLEDAE